MKWYQRRGVKWLIGLLVLLALLDWLTPLVYMSAAIDGKVVDAETKKPIEGVIVVVDWLLTSRIQGGYPVGEMAVFEVLTEGDGSFHIPRWGPRLNLEFLGFLRGDQPRLRIFKPGYLPVIVDNALPGRMYPEYSDRYLTFRLNGETSPLEKYDGSLDLYMREIDKLMFSLDFAFLGLNSGEYVETIPCTHLAFEKLRQVFDGAGVINSIRYRKIPKRQGHCGDVMESFGEESK